MEKPPTVFMEKSQGKQISPHSKSKEQNKQTNKSQHTYTPGLRRGLKIKGQKSSRDECTQPLKSVTDI